MIVAIFLYVLEKDVFERDFLMNKNARLILTSFLLYVPIFSFGSESSQKLFDIEYKVWQKNKEIANVVFEKNKRDDVIVLEEVSGFESKLIDLINSSNKHSHLFSDVDKKILSQQDSLTFKKECELFYAYIMQHNGLTTVSKKMFSILFKNLLGVMFREKNKEKADSEILSDDISIDSDVKFLQKFIINNSEAMQILLEQGLEFYVSLRDHIQTKRMIIPVYTLQDINIVHNYTIAITCQGLIKIIKAMNGSKAMQSFFIDMTIAFQEGFKELPYDVRHYIIAKLEQFVDDQNVELGINTLKMLVQQRRDILNCSNIDALDLEMYEKSLQVCIAKIKKIMMAKKQDQNIPSKKLNPDPNLIPGIVALERLIFKK